MFVNDIFKKKQLDEGGPFRSTEPKKPRKGSVADLAAKKRQEQERGQQPIEPKNQRVGTAKVVKEFLDDRNKDDDDGGDGRGRKSPKARARAQVLKMYGDGDITFRKTSNGGYFIQHEDDFGDTNSHQYDPQTGRVDFSGGTSSSYYGEGVADLAAQKRKEQEKGKQPIEPKDQQVGTAKVVKEFAPSGGGGGRWYSDDQLYEIIGEDWLEAFDVSGDQGNIDLNGERARLFLAQEAEAWLTDRGYRVNVLDVKDDGDSLSWYIQGPLYRGLAEGTQVLKLNDYDQWSDKVDAQGAVKHVQKNRTFVVAQSWDGEKIGEFDTSSNQGWVMTQGVAEDFDNIEQIKAKIQELEAEQEENEYGSFAYDSVDAELQFLYGKLDKIKKQGLAEGFDDLDRFMKDKYGPQPRGGSGIKTGTYGSPRRKRGRPTGAESLSGGSDIPHAVDFDRPHSERSAGRRMPRFSDDYDAIKRSEVDEGSAQEKLHKRHQELRKKSGLPDPDYYKELKASYDLPDQDRYAKQKEIKQKYKVTNEDREQYIEELGRAGYEIVTEKRMTCPECGGAAYEDKMLAEKQDACYHKVKSRYKVWPSAYASGALVRCRKKGAKNWGNKSK